MLLLKNREKRYGSAGNRGLSYFFAYTVCYVIIAAAIFSVFVINKKSFVWVPDGLQQHFNALVYYRSWLRAVLHTLFTEGKISIPLWDMHIGFGSDILTTLHYYVIGDPLNLLSVLVPDASDMEWFYDGMILFRIYLSGLAFSAYCAWHKQKFYSMLLGALIYDFCFWTIVAIRHPYFLNPMIYLPLILIGVDKIYKREKPWLYTGMLALAAVSSFYFSYMICIFVAGYAVLRYFMLFRRLQVKTVLVWFFRFLGYSLLAMMIAAFILVPVIMMMFSTGRAKAENYLPLLYPLSYYLKLVSGFLIGGSGYWSDLGYTGLGFIAVLFLFMNRKKYWGLRIGFVCMTLLLLFPFAGHLLNGGSYVINRYMWAYSMLVSFIAVKMYPGILNMKTRKKAVLFWAGVAYIVVCLEVWTRLKKTYILVALAMFAVTLWMIVATGRKVKERFWFKCLLLGMVMCELIYQGWVKYAPWAGNYVDEFADRGEALAMLTDYAPGSLVKNEEKSRTARYESLQTGEWKNTAMQLNLNGVSYYFSLANPYINQFQREMYLNQTRDFCYSGLDGRSILDILSGVCYIVIPDGSVHLLPYGYDKKISSQTLGEGTEYEGDYALYENPDALPPGFTSDNLISRKMYMSMTATEKQQALLQGIVTEDAGMEQTGQLIFTDQKIPYTIAEEKGLICSDSSITVEEEDAVLRLEFQGLPDSETYFELEGLDYSDGEGHLNKSASRLHIQIIEEKAEKKITYLSNRNNFYSGVTDFLINTGYRKDAVSQMTIQFKEKGTYRFKDLAVICQPMDQVESWQRRLAEDVLEEIVFSDNQMTGKITLDREKFLCVTLPYSKGWRAYIDGTETKVMQADTMYMAIHVPKGSHQIRFVYMTPYLKPGLCLTALGVGILGLLIIREGVRGNRGNIRDSVSVRKE